MFFYTLACPIKVCFQIPFGRGLHCVETSQSICKANWLTGFYILQVVAGGISKETRAQFVLIAKRPFFVTVAISFWWFCRPLTCSFTLELLCECFYTLCLLLFYRTILWWFLPLYVFFITNWFIFSFNLTFHLLSFVNLNLTFYLFRLVNLMTILFGAVL